MVEKEKGFFKHTGTPLMACPPYLPKGLQSFQYKFIQIRSDCWSICPSWLTVSNQTVGLIQVSQVIDGLRWGWRTPNKTNFPVSALCSAFIVTYKDLRLFLRLRGINMLISYTIHPKKLGVCFHPALRSKGARVCTMSVPTTPSTYPAPSILTCFPLAYDC